MLLSDKLHFIQVDLEKPLEEQGPFDLIIHKITDHMAAATDGDSQALRTMKGLEVIFIGNIYILNISYTIMQLTEQYNELLRSFGFINGVDSVDWPIVKRYES